MAHKTTSSVHKMYCWFLRSLLPITAFNVHWHRSSLVPPCFPLMHTARICCINNRGIFRKLDQNKSIGFVCLQQLIRIIFFCVNMSTSVMLPLYINLRNLIQRGSCFSLVEHLSLIHFFRAFDS